MKTKHLLMIPLLILTAIAGCKKDNPSDPVTPLPAPVPGQTVFQQLVATNMANATQSFTVNAATGGQVTGNKGTQLIFEPNAFVHLDGTPVTGQVNVELVEVLSIGDMIWLNKQTVGNDNGTLRMLRSGGELGLTVSQNGSGLRITPGGLVAKIPTNTGDPNMELFTGRENPNGGMIWTVVDSSIVDVEDDYYVDTTYVVVWPVPPITFDPASDSLQWINCDYFWNYPSTTNITASLPTGQSTDSTLVWIGFPSENAVMNMYHTTGQSFTAWQVVPVGMQAVVVGLRVDATGNYHSSFSTVTITSGMDVPMIFTPTTLAAFEDALNAI